MSADHAAIFGDVIDRATRRCGPCVSGGEPVRDHLSDRLTPEARAFVLARLDRGEADYGTQLLIGWPGAIIEAPQESGDLWAYLRAANAPKALIDRAADLHNDVLTWARSR
jgi:hypothetical protein